MSCTEPGLTTPQCPETHQSCIFLVHWHSAPSELIVIQRQHLPENPKCAITNVSPFVYRIAPLILLRQPHPRPLLWLFYKFPSYPSLDVVRFSELCIESRLMAFKHSTIRSADIMIFVYNDLDHTSFTCWKRADASHGRNESFALLSIQQLIQI
jgi:hypothetical protein